MSPTALFALAFAVTLALLVAVVVTGKKRLVKPHIVCVLLTLASLVWTIRDAYKMGEVYDLHSAGIITPIHLTLAKITTVALLAPLVTGVRTLYVPKTRSLHAKLAYSVLFLVVVCAATGVAMILMSNPR